MKKTYVFYLSDEYFKSTIKRFEELVKEGALRKMDYGFWRKIKSWLQDTDVAIQQNDPVRVATVYYTEGASVITLAMEDEGVKYSFALDGGGFGKYLYGRLNVSARIVWDNYTSYYTNFPQSVREAAWRKSSEAPASVVATGTIDPNNSIKLAATTADSITATTTSSVDDLTLSLEDFKTALSTTAETIKAFNDTTSGYVSTYKTTGCPPPDCNTIYWDADKYIVPQKNYESFQLTFKNTDDITINDKENKEMNKAFKFDFGKITDGQVRMSMYGLAVKNVSGAWTAYDKTAGDLMDVDVLNFDASNMLYKMPVAMKDVKVGDVIIHARKPMFVIGKTEADDLVAVDPVVGEKKTIMPSKSPFNFNYLTKVISLIDFTNTEVNENNPFGNLWMLMMMLNGNDNLNMKDILLLSMMNGSKDTDAMKFNPMMLMLMSDNADQDNWVLPLMLMNK